MEGWDKEEGRQGCHLGKSKNGKSRRVGGGSCSKKEKKSDKFRSSLWGCCVTGQSSRPLARSWEKALPPCKKHSPSFHYGSQPHPSVSPLHVRHLSYIIKLHHPLFSKCTNNIFFYLQSFFFPDSTTNQNFLIIEHTKEKKGVVRNQPPRGRRQTSTNAGQGCWGWNWQSSYQNWAANQRGT